MQPLNNRFIILIAGLVACWLSVHEVKGQTSFSVVTDKTQYKAGDTILLNIQVAEWLSTKRLGTANVLLEDANSKAYWKLRYPIIDGNFESSIIIPSDFEGGALHIAAELQPVFFQLSGRVLNAAGEDSVRYVLKLADNSMIAGVLALNKEGAFRMPRHVFSGNAQLFFSPYALAKKKKNTLNMVISTPLDSSFQPIASTRSIIFIGESNTQWTQANFRTDTNLLRNIPQSSLNNVIVTAKAKSKVEKLDESNASGFFKSDREQVFSGLDGEFSGFMSILDYLQGRVAGLTIQKSTDEFALYEVSWRNQPSAFFIDEIPVDVDAIYNFPPSDIAYIKVIPPPFQGMILGGGGGAIAIYTKKATLGLEPRFRNSFLIQGFTPEVFILHATQN